MLKDSCEEFQQILDFAKANTENTVLFHAVITTGFTLEVFEEANICHFLCMSRTSLKKWLDGKNAAHPAVRVVVYNWIDTQLKEKIKSL